MNTQRRASTFRSSVALSVLLAAVTAACASSGSGPEGTTRSGPGTVAIAGSGGPNMVVETYTPVAQSEHAVAAREVEIWPHLQSIFDQLEIEVTEVNASQRIMGNPRFRPRRIEGERLSTYVECGRDHAGAYADQHEVWLTFMVQLLRGPDGGTNVATLLTGTAQPRSVSASALPCESKQVLEPRLVALINERLGR